MFFDGSKSRWNGYETSDRRAQGSTPTSDSRRVGFQSACDAGGTARFASHGSVPTGIGREFGTVRRQSDAAPSIRSRSCHGRVDGAVADRPAPTSRVPTLSTQGRGQSIEGCVSPRMPPAMGDSRQARASSHSAMLRSPGPPAARQRIPFGIAVDRSVAAVTLWVREGWSGTARLQGGHAKQHATEQEPCDQQRPEHVNGLRQQERDRWTPLVHRD